MLSRTDSNVNDALSVIGNIHVSHALAVQCPRCTVSPKLATSFIVRVHPWLRDRWVAVGGRCGDGGREVHGNAMEGIWTVLRNFLRLFRGVNKEYLGQ